MDTNDSGKVSIYLGFIDVHSPFIRGYVEQVFGVVGTTLKKQGRFSFADLGTFTVSERAARKGRNPATGEAIKIKASKSVRFKPAPALKEMVAKVKVSK